MTSLLAGTAEANCQAFLSPFFQFVTGPDANRYVTYSYVSMQSNQLVGYSSSEGWTNWLGMMRKNPAGQLDSRVPFDSGPTLQLFSDRRGSNDQPFWMGNADSMDLVVAPDGDVWLISNTWGVTTHIDNPTCANNVLYGFGAPIGNHTSPALYIFSFGITSQIG
ncbi:hypothetical protein F0U60_33090 [Archangium minus]|uniref:Uncharacterized protein n=1 Tax=Archangium minus TaxID=83450 RepID=A0ABY9WZ59_9BACT|nr:hypothetical protein F0U60_33090 [Archangium minus]